MATAPNLPTNVAAGATGHAQLHNDVNASVNQLREDVDALQLGPEDSGWRTLASPGGNVMRGRRIGNLVTLVMSWDGWTFDAAVVPEGFRPLVDLEVDQLPIPYHDWDNEAVGMLRLYSGGTVELTSVSPGTTGVLTCTYVTVDAFPDPLPGTPFPPA